MNEIITIQNYPLTIVSSLFCLAIIVIQFFSWRAAFKYSDPTFVVIGSMLSVVFAIIVGTMPVKEHTQLHDISKFDIMETDRFIKIFDKETGSEIYQTTNHYTITQMKKWTHVQYHWDTNILGFVPMKGEYTLVQK